MHFATLAEAFGWKILSLPPFSACLFPPLYNSAFQINNFKKKVSKMFLKLKEKGTVFSLSVKTSANHIWCAWVLDTCLWLMTVVSC